MERNKKDREGLDDTGSGGRISRCFEAYLEALEILSNSRSKKHVGRDTVKG